MPAITIGIPVYNGETHIAETLRSLLAQTFTDFELLVVDDGSTDGTADIVNAFAAEDGRIRLHKNERNMGVGYTANRLFDLANGKYLARADADDIHMPDRLERQWNLMESAPELAASGGCLRYFGGGSGDLILPETHDAVKCHMMFYTSVAQPVVILRLDFFRRTGLRYDEKLRAAEDYDLWQRILHERDGRMANLPQVLAAYRVHASSLTGASGQLMRNMAARTLNRVLLTFLPDATEDEMALHGRLHFGPLPRGRGAVSAVHAWLLRLIEANKECQTFAPEAWNTLLAQQFFRVVQANLHLGPRVIRELTAFPGFNSLQLTVPEMEELLTLAAQQASARSAPLTA